MKRFVFLLCLLWCITSLHAQFLMRNDSIKRIYVGPVDVDRVMGINIKNLNGMYWTGRNPGEFAQLCLCAIDPRIAGTCDTVFFGYSASSLINIYVDKVIYMNKTVNPINSLMKISALKPLQKIAKRDYRNLVELMGKSDDNIDEYGLDVDCLKKVIPEAVTSFGDSQYGIDYEQVVNYLVNSFCDLEKRLEEQKRELCFWEGVLQGAENVDLANPAVSGQVITCKDGVIEFALPKTMKDGFVQICDEQGQQKCMINILGKDRILMDRNILPSGKGFCSIVCDKKVLQTIPISF